MQSQKIYTLVTIIMAQTQIWKSKVKQVLYHLTWNQKGNYFLITYTSAGVAPKNIEAINISFFFFFWGKLKFFPHQSIQIPNLSSSTEKWSFVSYFPHADKFSILNNLYDANRVAIIYPEQDITMVHFIKNEGHKLPYRIWIPTLHS